MHERAKPSKDRDLASASDAQSRRELESLHELRDANERLVVASVREQELAEQARQRAAELEALLASSSEGIAIMDPDGVLLMLNASGRAILGWSDATGTPELGDLCVQTANGQPLDLREHVLARVLRGERIADEELLLPRAGESRRHILLSASGVRDAHGAVRLAIAVFRDVTHLRELERTREQYLALISHDLRNPLATAATIASFMEGRATAERDRDLARALVINLTRMDEMLQKLLDVQHVRAGHELPIELAEVDLRALAQESLAAVSLVHGNRFDLRCDEVIRGVWSEAELRRAVLNLLVNAAKHGAPDGRITVHIREEEGRVALSVHNHGHPIPPEAGAGLFEPFTRLPREGILRAKGWGLGLVLVRACARAHGGEVQVESDATAGTTFSLVLPRDARRHGADETRPG